MKALKRLHKLFFRVCRKADRILDVAAMNTTDIWTLPGKFDHVTYLGALQSKKKFKKNPSSRLALPRIDIK